MRVSYPQVSYPRILNKNRECRAKYRECRMNYRVALISVIAFARMNIRSGGAVGEWQWGHIISGESIRTFACYTYINIHCRLK